MTSLYQDSTLLIVLSMVGCLSLVAMILVCCGKKNTKPKTIPPSSFHSEDPDGNAQKEEDGKGIKTVAEESIKDSTVPKSSPVIKSAVVRLIPAPKSIANTNRTNSKAHHAASVLSQQETTSTGETVHLLVRKVHKVEIPPVRKSAKKPETKEKKMTFKSGLFGRSTPKMTIADAKRSTADNEPKAEPLTPTTNREKLSLPDIVDSCSRVSSCPAKHTETESTSNVTTTHTTTVSAISGKFLDKSASKSVVPFKSLPHQYIEFLPKKQVTELQCASAKQISQLHSVHPESKHAKAEHAGTHFKEQVEGHQDKNLKCKSAIEGKVTEAKKSTLLPSEFIPSHRRISPFVPPNQQERNVTKTTNTVVRSDYIPVHKQMSYVPDVNIQEKKGAAQKVSVFLG